MKHSSHLIGGALLSICVACGANTTPAGSGAQQTAAVVATPAATAPATAPATSLAATPSGGGAAPADHGSAGWSGSVQTGTGTAGSGVGSMMLSGVGSPPPAGTGGVSSVPPRPIGVGGTSGAPGVTGAAGAPPSTGGTTADTFCDKYGTNCGYGMPMRHADRAACLQDFNSDPAQQFCKMMHMDTAIAGTAAGCNGMPSAFCFAIHCLHAAGLADPTGTVYCK